MPDLDLLQITHHAWTAVSSALPGIIFKILGQDRHPTTQFLEHSQSHSTESTWHTVSQSYIWYLGLHDTKQLVFSLFSLSLPHSLSLCLSLFLWKKYRCSDTMDTESIGKSLKRSKVYVELRRNVSHTWIFSGVAAYVESIGHQC